MDTSIMDVHEMHRTSTRIKARSRRRRPRADLGFLAAVAVAVALPALTQAFQLPFHPQAHQQHQQQPCHGASSWTLTSPTTCSSSSSSSRQASRLVLMAKAKKSLDAAKAAALAALEEIEAMESAAAPPMLAPSSDAGMTPLDKKLAKKAKKEKEKAEKEALKAAMAPPPDVSTATSPKAAREAAMAALAALESEDSDSSSEDDDDDAALEAMVSQGGGGGKKKKKKDKKGGGGGAMSMDLDTDAAAAAADPAPVTTTMGVGLDEAPPKKAMEMSMPTSSAPEMVAESKKPEAAGEDDGRGPLPPDPPPQVGPTLEEKMRAARPAGSRVRIMTEGVEAGTTFLRLDKVSVIFRNQEVIKDASWGVQTGDRIGLVGPNGGGKTTQLKVLAGDLEPTTGEVLKSSKSVKVAMLRQEFVDELVLERTLKEEFLSVFTEEQAVLAKLRDLETQLEGATSDMDAMNKILQDLADTQAEADRRGVYGLETRVDKIMDMMGFTPSDASLPVRAFSGGWKMRIGLGKVLMQEPGVLMLDEPTNHLDLDSVEWLESFLRTQTLPMIIVSHDREFLDRVCTKIVDCDGGETVAYTGNYSNFLKQKKARLEAWQKAYDNQQKKIQEEKDFINRFRANAARAPQVKSREAALEKLMKSDDLVKRPPFQGTAFRFRFPPGPRLQGEVVAIEHMKHGYGNDALFDDANLTIEKGHRVAIIGPNGVGKSTLLRLVMGLEKPSSGRAAITASNAVANYFEQNQADALDLDKTVDETIMGASSTESYNQLRSLMAQFLFKGDAIYKKVGQLSGGEKARVALCKMMLKPGNLLCLDEPTNHLDIPAKEILEEACRNYDGAILLVSHDRYFVSQVANRIVAVEDKKLAVYEGDYKYYMEKNEDMKAKIEGRYVDGTSGIRAAPKMDEEAADGKGKGSKKNFGGKAPGISGRKEKGVKNAKRMTL